MSIFICLSISIQVSEDQPRAPLKYYKSRTGRLSNIVGLRIEVKHGILGFLSWHKGCAIGRRDICGPRGANDACTR